MKRISIFLFLAFCPAMNSLADGQKPNVVLLLTDDQSYHLGMLGVKGLATPHIDALAEQGTFFTKAYSSAASCAPWPSIAASASITAPLPARSPGSGRGIAREVRRRRTSGAPLPS